MARTRTIASERWGVMDAVTRLTGDADTCWDMVVFTLGVNEVWREKGAVSTRIRSTIDEILLSLASDRFQRASSARREQSDVCDG